MSPITSITRDTTADHTLGDLKSVSKSLTTTLKHITYFNSYNKNGQPTQITGPTTSTATNGIKYAMTYFPRGWLKTLTVTASDNSTSETTTYDYWPTGLLKKATLPDGSYLTYTYDNAHRLTDIQDNLGNKVHYDLDSMGNRVKETYWDSSSATLPNESVSTTGLHRKITRVYDALNRLQTVTGAAQ